MKKYFLAARGTYGNLHETFPPSNLMNLRHIDSSGTGQVAALTARIDKIKAGKGWGVFTFHGISTTHTGGLHISEADFDALTDYIAAQGMPVLPVRKVVRGFAARI